MRAKSPARPALGFIEKTILSFGDALDHAAFADEIARGPGLLQLIDPRVKVCGFFLIILAAVSAPKMLNTAGALFLGVALAQLSRIPLRVLLVRVWLAVLSFTGIIALPALFLTPGRVVFRLPGVEWGITAQGLTTGARLVIRGETTATLALVLVLSTPWTHVLKALRALRAPSLIVMILCMTYRYIFLLIHVARDFFEARRSRLVGVLDSSQRRHLAAATAGVLLGRSMDLSNEVFLAMQSRGFSGSAFTIDDFRFKTRDAFAIAGFAVAAALVLFV